MLYVAIHDGSHWKIQDRRQIKNTDIAEAKHPTHLSHQQINSTSQLASSSNLTMENLH